jgi:DNA polymerase-1
MSATTELPAVGDPRTLYVVDISGYVFRAYHALPPLASPSGEPTHAVLGVTTMLRKLIADRQPAMLVAAMDSPGKSFRHELYADYKGTRPPAPEDLPQQMTRVREVLDAQGIAVAEQAGVEADDVIASLVRKAREDGLQVVIVSADKDLLQLVGPDVTVFDTAKSRVFGVPETEAKLGVPPAAVRDYLALVGDSSDNVPGVPSVGPKTAVDLLQRFGDLDGVYAGLDEITRKALRAKLEANRDQAYLSQRLVTLRDDIEVPWKQAREPLGEGDVERTRALFTELGFTRLLDQLPAGDEVGKGDAAASRAPKREATVPAIVSDAKALGQLVGDVEKVDELIVLSVIDGRAVDGTFVGLVLAWAEGAAYVPVAHAYLGCPEQLEATAVVEALRASLERAEVRKVCADAKREMIALAGAGVTLAGVAFDVGLASYLIDSERHAHRLQDVARFDLNFTAGELEALLGTLDAPSGVEIAEVSARAGRSIDVLRQAHEVLVPRLEQVGGGALLSDMELPLARVLADMERTGVRVDIKRLDELAREVGERLVEIEARCKELAGRDFNVGSPRQLEAILFDELQLPVIKRTKTARSTDQSVLEELAVLHELPVAVLEHRMLTKLASTYLETLPREVSAQTGRIHSDFRQTVAATGRLSSSDPNLQNIPIRTEVGRQIRGAFVPREGWRMLSADYSQIELRVLAHLSGDEELSAAFRENADVHARTARAIFGVEEDELTREMRGRAKTVNYAVIYGQTQFALARNLRIQRNEAKRYIDAFFERYSGVRAYMDRVVEEAKEQGLVRTLCGRVRRVPEIDSRNRMRREAAARIARNTPIQGSAADILKLAMIATHRDMAAAGMQAKMLLSVHDELVFEAPSDEEDAVEKLVVDRMQNAMKLDVPLVVDRAWGANWGEIH